MFGAPLPLLFPHKLAGLRLLRVARRLTLGMIGSLPKRLSSSSAATCSRLLPVHSLPFPDSPSCSWPFS